MGCKSGATFSALCRTDIHLVLKQGIPYQTPSWAEICSAGQSWHWVCSYKCNLAVLAQFHIYFLYFLFVQLKIKSIISHFKSNFHHTLFQNISWSFISIAMILHHESLPLLQLLVWNTLLTKQKSNFFSKTDYEFVYVMWLVTWPQQYSTLHIWNHCSTIATENCSTFFLKIIL